MAKVRAVRSTEQYHIDQEFVLISRDREKTIVIEMGSRAVRVPAEHFDDCKPPVVDFLAINRQFGRA